MNFFKFFKSKQILMIESKYFEGYKNLVDLKRVSFLLDKYKKGPAVFEPIRKKFSEKEQEELFEQIDKFNAFSPQERIEAIIGLMMLLDGIFPEEPILVNLGRIFGEDFIKIINQKRYELEKLEKKEIILFKDKEWSLIDGEICRVVDFIPMGGVVKNGKVVVTDRIMPYASIHLECKKTPQKIIGFITHRIDFINLWNAFKERGVKENEEVLIIWSAKHYKNKIIKALSRIMPKLWVMICPRNAFERLTDNNFEPELRGEARAEAILPIADWKPEVME